MKEKTPKLDVSCPRCNKKLSINPILFNEDSLLTCFNCGLRFSINGSLAEKMKEEIPKLKAELKKRIIETEKGNIKLSPEEIKEMKEALNKANKAGF